MREIKFRGLTGNDNWVYGHYFYDPIHDAHQIVGQGGIFYTVKPETVNQYTGLHDKNGKEIYEGDIVQTWNRDLYSDTHKWSKWQKIGDGIGSVYFDDYDFRWRVVCKGNFNPVFMPSDSSRAFSIIGNIYESKHLLDNIDMKD